ncbi:MAG: hypothetical protein HGB35_00795 [Geobacteraceae bacterium]|nr:hypothetical protein [Geobacteraceae bacterium]
MNPVISILDVRDLDIKDAVKIIAQKSGINIVVGETAQGKVTVYLENIRARDALATVLQMSRLAYEDSAGLLQVITDQEYQSKYGRPFSQRVTTRLFRLKGMKAATAASLLEKFKNQFGKVVADDVSGTVYVEDTPLKLAEIEEYLRDVDRPLETRALQLSYIEADTVASRLNGLVTNGIGSVRADKQSNKIFVTDVADRLIDIEQYLKEVDVPRKSQVFELSYVKADEMLSVIKNYLTPELGAIEINKPSNQLILTDTAAKLKELADIIKQLDRKQKEVLIEARIVQVVLKDEFKMGIDWDAIVKNAHGLELKTNWGGTGTLRTSSLAIGTLSDDNYRAVLEALGNANKTHMLSNPRIAVLNNEEAKILVGSTKPYVTTQTTTPSTGPVTVSEEVKFIDVGVKLVVTPIVHPDNFITMKIRPEVSSAATSITTGQNNVIPIVDKSEVETTVRVKDGVTIVIGGLIKDENSRGESKVPLLGDIPVVGSAFKSTSRSKEKTEIVIFLTPKIISGDLQ